MSVISLNDVRKRLAKSSISKSPSKPNTATEKRGQIPTKKKKKHREELEAEAVAHKLKAVLDEAWQGNFTTKSDFARVEADWVAMAASLGFITVLITMTQCSRFWMITEEGLVALDEINLILQDI